MRRALPPILLASTLSCAIWAMPTAACAQDPVAAPQAGAKGDSTSAPPSLTSVVRAVVEQFPLVLAAETDKTAAEGELLGAQGGFDPIFRTRAAVIPTGYYTNGRLDTVVTQPTPLWGTSVFAGYRIGTGSFPVYDGKLATLGHGEVRAGLNVPIWRDGPIDARRAALWSAQLAPKIAEAGVVSQKLEVVRAVTLRYWNWVESGKAVQIARDVLALAEERDAALAERVTRGDLAEIERQDNQRAIVARRAALVQFERARKGAAIELSFYLQGLKGAPTFAEGKPVPEFPEPAIDARRAISAEVDRALARRPEVSRLAAQKEQISFEIQLTENQTRPAIDLQAVVAKDFGPGPEQLRPADVELGLVIDIPILARVARGKVAMAMAKQKKVDYQMTLLRNRIAADVNDALVAKEAARERLTLARVELGLAKRLAQAEREALELGNATILIVNLREQAVADAALKEIAALADYHRAVAVYQAVTATTPAVSL